MEAKHLDWSPSTLKLSRKKINTKPQYQRTEVWSESKKQRLIDSILRNYDIPKFYIARSTGGFEYEVVDGQQRITAILDFMDGKFPLPDDTEIDRWKHTDLTGAYFDDLPLEIQSHINEFNLNFVLLNKASDEEVRDLFRRLQEGIAMNEAEKRNALMGNMRDFIADLTGHKVFKSAHILKDRFGWDDLIAHITCLEIASGPADVKAKNLKQMYENNKKFDKNGSIAIQVKKVLNFINKGLSSSPAPEMDIKWGFVDLYLVITKFFSEYSLKDLEQEFIKFYVNFEQKRRSNFKNYKNLASGDMWDKRLFDYIEAFRTGGGTRANIEIRHLVYKEFALQYFSQQGIDLAPKDAKRDFSRDERLVIWRRAKAQCQNSACERTSRDISFDEMEADHINPHSRGGKTIISNGQCLCIDCNRRKSASI